ncbi:MAG: MOSC domain-containing protein, partial [Pseudomonadota bacterium]
VRCAAVSVVPGLGSVPENLVKRIYARTKTTCFGVYAEVLVGGTLKVGDPVTIGEAAPRAAHAF